jgi:hypothetical protein
VAIKELSDMDTVYINNSLYVKVTDTFEGAIEAVVEQVIAIEDCEKKVKNALVLKDVTLKDYGRVKMHSPGTKVRIVRISEES